MIATGVVSREEHERRIRSPDGYRPPECPGCHGAVLHVHDYRERHLRGDAGAPTTRIVRHDCTRCDAVWQTLPEFLARHLWRSWPVVERAMMGEARSIDGRLDGWPNVPARTVRRWSARWRAAARFLVRILAACGEALWASLGADLGIDATRGDAVACHSRYFSVVAGRRLALFGAQLDGLAAGVRLM